MAELVFFRRGEEVLRYSLGNQGVVLGRGDKCDLVIPDGEVSRQQAAIERHGEEYVLRDLSGRGTMVSGERRPSATLADGVDIGLGQWRALFRLHGSSDDAMATDVQGTRTEQQPEREPAVQQPRPAQLRSRRGHVESVHRLTLEADLTVGKDPSCDLVVDDKFVSSRHLRIARLGGLFRLTDLGSRNGTFVGNARVFEAAVPLFTSVRLGDTELILEPASQGKKDEAASYHGIIGGDHSMRQLVELIEKVAPSTASVAIFGESGTGKELVARAVHVRSPRAERAFIPVNCAAISKELIESELFGHEKGAFTGALNARKGAFEEADGGTLFLDEIGELPLDLQAKLLRALESGEIKRVGASRPQTVDVRVVAATNRDLLAQVQGGRFREDLFYRLNVVPLHLPPLRSRQSDVMTLAEHFVRTFAPHGQTVLLTPAARERLQTHRWPGNVRELRNVIHRALLLRKGPNIDGGDLSFDTEVDPQTGVVIPDLAPGMTLEQLLAKVERTVIETALKKWDNNRERVAKELGVARSTLFKRLKEWGITRDVEDAG